MQNNKECESFVRSGTEPDRCYYIPFDEKVSLTFHYGILHREKSSLFISFDGRWSFRSWKNADEVDVDGSLTEEIDVPSCVQMKGFDSIQYLNTRYPIPFDPPHVPFDNPAFHYRRTVDISAEERKNYRFISILKV